MSVDITMEGRIMDDNSLNPTRERVVIYNS